MNKDSKTYTEIYEKSGFGKRIIIASGEGAKSTMAVRQYILNLRKNSPAYQINQRHGL